MQRYWAPVIRPLLEATRPAVVLDVGWENDEMARQVARACDDLGAQGHIVRHDLGMPETDASTVAIHRDPPLRVLAGLDGVDVTLVHGHPNWHTVTELLDAVVEHAAVHRHVPPVIMVGQVRWPFGRRDGYPDPALVPHDLRHPAQRHGIAPGCGGLDELGLDPGMPVAVHEHGPRNGVRTAIDDFIGRGHHAWTVVDLPGFGGLAVLAAPEKLAGAPALGALIAGLAGQAFLEDHSRRLELERVRTTIALRRASRENAALQTARHDAEQAERQLSQAAADHEQTIIRLQGQLDAARIASAEAKSRATALTSELAEVRRQAWSHDAERARLAAAERAHAVAETRLDVQQQAAAAMEHELRSSRRRLEEQLAAARGELGELRTTLATRDRELTHAREASVELRDQVDQAEQRLAQSRGEIDQLHEAIEREASARAALERETESHAGELRAARDQERHLTGRLAEIDADHVRAQRRLVALEAEIAERQAHLDRMTQDRDTAREHVERARASAAWRIGHRTTRVLRRLTFRPAVRSASALDEAIVVLTELPPQLPPAARSSADPEGSAAAATATNGRHLEVP